MPDAGFDTRTVGAEGRRTRFAAATSPSAAAVPLVLVHGVGLDHTVWRPQMEAFAATRPVYALDLYGHGGSDLPERSLDLADYAAQVLTLLDRLDIPAAHLVGHSMGAMIVLDVALSHPTRVASVCALNAVYERSPAQRAAVLDRVAAIEAGEIEMGVEPTVERWFGSPVPPALAADADAMRALLGRVDPRGYAKAYRVFATSDRRYSGRLGDLAVPALFMTGQFDPNSTPDMTRAMAAAAPGSRCRVLSGERHMMPLVGAERVNAELLAFLDAAEAGSADPKRFRTALGTFATGVTVVTTLQADGQPRGFTANSFSSVSLDPPLISICIARTASSHPVFSAAPHFAVNILASDQRDVSGVFASKRPDKFEAMDWVASATGSPILDGSAAWFDCRLHQVVPAGDHDIIIGEVVDFDKTERMPLGYCRGAYVDFALSREALAAIRSVEVCAILERDGQVLLAEDRDGLGLPCAPRLEPASDRESLHGTLAADGVSMQLGFLFAVFETPASQGAPTAIVYRGTYGGNPGAGLRPWPVEALAQAPIRDPAVRAMLERYARERAENVFGIYSGTASEGTVQTLTGTSAA